MPTEPTPIDLSTFARRIGLVTGPTGERSRADDPSCSVFRPYAGVLSDGNPRRDIDTLPVSRVMVPEPSRSTRAAPGTGRRPSPAMDAGGTARGSQTEDSESKQVRDLLAETRPDDGEHTRTGRPDSVPPNTHPFEQRWVDGPSATDGVNLAALSERPEAPTANDTDSGPPEYRDPRRGGRHPEAGADEATTDDWVEHPRRSDDESPGGAFDTVTAPDTDERRGGSHPEASADEPTMNEGVGQPRRSDDESASGAFDTIAEQFRARTAGFGRSPPSSPGSSGVPGTGAFGGERGRSHTGDSRTDPLSEAATEQPDDGPRDTGRGPHTGRGDPSRSDVASEGDRRRSEDRGPMATEQADHGDDPAVDVDELVDRVHDRIERRRRIERERRGL